ncbi:MAG TPA: hypothetical protein VF629_10785 [Hymenobacter sp.]|uniref:hypothetical protein n=1 Tax=Hymenobacter sp. TaxID=1898978 RepID=UPI002EDB0EF6
MPSVATAPAAPVVGAAAGKLAALHATLARLEAMFPPRPRPVPQPAPAPIAPAAVAARQALARAHSAYFDARAAKYALRDDYSPQPGRFAQLRAAIIRCREAQATYKAAAAAFHASPAGVALQAARASYPIF